MTAQEKRELTKLILQARSQFQGPTLRLPAGPEHPWSQRAAEVIRTKPALSKLSTAINTKRKKRT